MKYKKNLVFGLLALCISQICFFNFGGIGIENNVFAADETTQQTVDFQGKASEKFQELSFIQKIIYLLIYPMLVIAGKLVDNSLVYGKSLGFDVVLWELWNIMRNLANFTLGFIFVYKIFKYLISGQKKDDIKKLLTSLLIAGVGIQASWFIMAALIDMSTILTYGVGGLPISVLKNNIGTGGEDDTKDPFILKTIVDVDVSNVDKSTTYLTNTLGEHFYISECETAVYGDTKRELLLAPKMIYFEYYEGTGKVYKQTISSGCHFGGQVYYFSRLYDGIVFQECGTKQDCEDKQTAYDGTLTNARTAISKGGTGIIQKISEAVLLEQGNVHMTGGILGGLWTGSISNPALGLDVNNRITAGSGRTERLHDILDTSNSYVGVFSALYSSLINSGQGILGNAGGVYEALLAIAISLGHLIAIAIPLIVVGIVFMIRVGILWIAIVISPFIAILTAFKDLGDKIKEHIKFLDYFNLENLLKIIFAPAIVCLAISLSTVLVTTMANLDFSGVVGNDILGGLIKLDFSGVAVMIGRFISAIFGIAITWFIVWAAIESSKIGNMGFIQSLKNLAESSIGSIPIVPIPGKNGQGVEFVGTRTAFGGDGQGGVISQLSNKIQNEYQKKDTEAMEQLIYGEEKAEKARENRESSYQSQLLAQPKESITEGRTEQPIRIGEKDFKFNDLSGKGKDAIITAINGIDDVEKRKAFGRKTSITFEDSNGKVVTYNFVEKDKDGKEHIYEKVEGN